jgi:hypothetical protein
MAYAETFPAVASHWTTVQAVAVPPVATSVDPEAPSTVALPGRFVTTGEAAS